MRNESPIFSTIRTPSSYPASGKRYPQSSRSDLRVPYREVTLSDTHQGDHNKANPPLPVYDTSGPYTDPEIGIRLTWGLPALRSDWIKERGDTEALRGHSSEYARGLEINLLKFHLRFPSPFSFDPVRMASAFGKAIKGGRNAFLAGPMIVQEKAVSSTPEMGRPFTPESLQSAGPQGRATAPV